MIAFLFIAIVVFVACVVDEFRLAEEVEPDEAYRKIGIHV